MKSLSCFVVATLPLLVERTWAGSGITWAKKTNSSIFLATSIASGNAEASSLFSGCQVYDAGGTAISNGSGFPCVKLVFEWMLYAMAVAPNGDNDVATAISGPGNVTQHFSQHISRASKERRVDDKAYHHASFNTSAKLVTNGSTLQLSKDGGYTTASLIPPPTHKPRDLVSIPDWQYFRFSGVDGLKIDGTNYGIPQSSTYESDIMTLADDFYSDIGNSDRWQYQICSNEENTQMLVNGSIIVEATGFGINVEPLAAMSCGDVVRYANVQGA
ncbi:hypothetical protein LTR78_009351 [Recurvomyces mirabilis]|uniref:Uncharacterized protein n=1 Tax=Recurvomyces mirabilis TaxID=574656 RepID=A0AAE0WGK2_9PEZI|nr:hypothetical protein LTR78_009351 [Recurvomyces mirabilis]